MEIVLNGTTDFVTVLNASINATSVAIFEIICNLPNINNIRENIWIELLIENVAIPQTVKYLFNGVEKFEDVVVEYPVTTIKTVVENQTVHENVCKKIGFR